MIAKVALISIMKDHFIRISEKSKKKIDFDPYSSITSTRNGSIWFKLTQKKN